MEKLLKEVSVLLHPLNFFRAHFVLICLLLCVITTAQGPALCLLMKDKIEAHSTAAGSDIKQV